MGYYEGEKSVGLGPIVLALSLVAMVGFGSLYFLFGHDGHNLETTRSNEISAPQTQPVKTEQGQPGKDSAKVTQHSRV